MAQYSQFAEQFSRTREWLVWPEITMILECIFSRNSSPKNILDIGCWSGRFFQNITNFMPLDIPLVWIDPCRELLDVAHAKQYHQKNITWLEWSFESMENLNLGQFDIIAAIASFHHIIWKWDSQQAVLSIFNHLLPGGYFAMTNWNLFHEQYQWKYGKYRTEENNQVYYDIPFDGNHRRYVAWSMKELQELFDPQYWNILLHTATPETEKNIITIVQKKSV